MPEESNPKKQQLLLIPNSSHSERFRSLNLIGNKLVTPVKLLEI